MDKKVSEYIEKQKSPQKEILKRLRKIVQELAPNAQEAMIYGVPGFRLNGKYLIVYAAFKEHIGMPFQPSDAWLAEVKSRVVELPLARKQRFMRDYDLTTDQAEALKMDLGASDQFEKAAREVIAENLPPKERTRLLRAIANTIIQQWRPKLMSQGLGWPALVVPISGTIGVSASFVRGEISSSAYQQVTAEMFATGQAPEKIIQAKGLAHCLSLCA